MSDLKHIAISCALFIILLLVIYALFNASLEQMVAAFFGFIFCHIYHWVKYHD